MPYGYVALDVVVVRIEKLGVLMQAPQDDLLACVITAACDDGKRRDIGLTRAALSELVSALIENSPRTPGTPGRN